MNNEWQRSNVCKQKSKHNGHIAIKVLFGYVGRTHSYHIHEYAGTVLATWLLWKIILSVYGICLWNMDVKSGNYCAHQHLINIFTFNCKERRGKDHQRKRIDCSCCKIYSYVCIVKRRFIEFSTLTHWPQLENKDFFIENYDQDWCLFPLSPCTKFTFNCNGLLKYILRIYQLCNTKIEFCGSC